MQEKKGFLDKLGSGFIELYRNAVTWIFFTIVLFLFFITSISTTILTRDDEGGHFFIRGHISVGLIAAALLLIIGVFARKSRKVQNFLERIKTDEAFFKSVRIKMLVVLGVISAIWVLSSQLIPGADQLRIMDGVSELHVEDYSRYEPGEYFERYQNQYGLLLLTYLFSALFGNANYVVFSIFNIAALLVIYYEMSEICGDFEFGRTAQLAVIAAGIAFYPMIIYCSYIYGTLIGLACAVAALDFELKYFSGKKHRHAVFSALLIMLAIIIKSNYLIFLIAIAICAVIEVIRQKKFALTFLPLMLAAGAILSSLLPKAAITAVVGEPIAGGASSWGWIAMGLQEGPRAPGAFNDYNIQLYMDCNCDTNLHAELAKENIKARLKQFSENKVYAASFFTQKQAYQWGDPTFQFAWNIRGKSSVIGMPTWLYRFKSPKGAAMNADLLDPMISAVFFGALLYCLLCRSNTNIYTIALSMTFVGGFIFHSFWEAAPRYTLPYFVLLFPLAAAGYIKLIDIIAIKKRKKSEDKNSAKEKMLQFVPYICITLAFYILAGVYNIGLGGYLTSDNNAYEKWLESTVSTTFKEGNYLLTTGSDKGITLSFDRSGGKYELGLSDKPTPIRLVTYQDTYWFKFPEEHLYIAVSDDSDPQNMAVSASNYTPEDTSNKWRLREAEDGISIIYGGKYALTYDEASGTVCARKYNNKDKNQIWHLEKE